MAYRVSHLALWGVKYRMHVQGSASVSGCIPNLKSQTKNDKLHDVLMNCMRWYGLLMCAIAMIMLSFQLALSSAHPPSHQVHIAYYSAQVVTNEGPCNYKRSEAPTEPCIDAKWRDALCSFMKEIIEESIGALTSHEESMCQ